jgi:PAS domain S-box-containing protein
MPDRSGASTIPRILIVAGEVTLANNLARSLTNLGYQVVGKARSPADAVAEAEKLEPDIVLIDIKLRGKVDGIEANEPIRRSFDVPVIFLTDWPEEDGPFLANQTEPWSYLASPFSAQTLKIAIEAASYKYNAGRRFRETEARYRALVEQVPAITYTAELDGESTTLYISPQVEALLGFSQGDFGVDSGLWRRRLHAEDRERVMAEVAHSNSTGDSFCSEYRMLARDGREVWVHDEAKMVSDEDGRPVCLQGVMMDITALKNSLEALRESELRFRTVFNNAAVGVDVLDKYGRFIEVNAALAKMLGYSVEELAEIGPLDLTHPDDLEESRECLNQFVDGKRDSYRLEKRYIRKDGSILFADVMVSKILDPYGKYAATIGVISDITERRKAEDALRVKTHQLGERVKELNCLLGISQLLEKNNASLKEMLQGIVDLIPAAWQFPEVTCARINLDHQEFRTRNYGAPVSTLSVTVLANGEAKGFLEVSYLKEKPQFDEGPFLKEERNLLNAIAERVGRILERQEAEKELARYRNELEDRVRQRTMELARRNEQLRHEIDERKKAEEALSQTAGELERSNKDLEQFAYVAAHDLREPLIGVTAYLKVLERRSRGRLDADLQKYVTRAINTLLRMDRLVQGLLAYSLVKHEKAQFEAIDCNVVVKQTLANLGSAIRESGARVTADNLPIVMGNSAQLIQLYQNLISNAIKFSGDSQPEIHISVAHTEKEYRFSFADNGIGIAPPYFDRVFRIFQRLENGSDQPGSGIGLASCQKIVERHGGRIWVESQPGCGSTFHFTIPVKETS